MDNFNKIYEDDSIIVINKPAGMLSIPDRYDSNVPNLKYILEDIYGEIFIVHRLDKGTSGVMLFAKTPESHAGLSEQFEQRQIKKIYHAVVGGVVPKEEIEIDIPLLPNPAKKGMAIPSARGKESLSILRVLEKFRHATHVVINLVTGRQHQIRVHVATIGHPLIVDSLYGSNKEFYLSTIKRKFNIAKNEIERPIISRISMHSYSLGFIHPQTGERLHFEADYPKDYRVLLQVLRKYSSIEY